MKKLLLICFLITIFLGIAIGANAKYMWNAGAAPEGTTSYVCIGVLSETANTHTKDVLMTPIAFSKSLVGLKAFDQKQAVSMYASAQQLEQIINKEGPFSPETYKWSAPVAQMMWLWDEDEFFLIRKEDADKIKNYSDLANRPAFCHMLGTGTYEILKAVFGPQCLDIWDTMDIKSFEYSHTSDALKLKEVDAVAGYSSGGAIVGFIQEVLARTDSVMLVPTPEELEKILKAFSFLSAATMRPETYGQDVGLTKTIKNPGIGYVYIVDPDVPEEFVYQVVKAAFENATEMSKVAGVWRKFAEDPWEFNFPYLLKYKKMGVPIHPGVLRYFRELGYDTKLLGLE